jgi:hypothetical protein
VVRIGGARGDRASARAGGRCSIADYPRTSSAARFPGAVNLSDDEIADRIAELDTVAPPVVFCNGPQCPATAQAIGALLAADGRMSGACVTAARSTNWATLGQPLATSASRAALVSRRRPRRKPSGCGAAHLSTTTPACS